MPSLLDIRLFNRVKAMRRARGDKPLLAAIEAMNEAVGLFRTGSQAPGQFTRQMAAACDLTLSGRTHRDFAEAFCALTASGRGTSRCAPASARRTPSPRG